MRTPILKTVFAAGLLTFTSHAFSGEDTGFYVWADVVDVDPIVSTHYEQVPTSNCRTVKRPRYRDRSRNDDALPTLFGGLLGGVIGNQFGRGNGKRAMTVIGAIAGASIASNNANDRHHRKERICETDYETQRVESVDGYRVTYEYLGQEFERITDDHPGDRVRLHVTAEPVLAKYI